MKKQEILARILYLRKLCKNNRANQCGLEFSRIPLLVNKYETFSSLSYSEFTFLFFPEREKQTVIKLNTITQEIYRFEVKTVMFDKYCRSIQISNKQFVAICGYQLGNGDDRLSIISEGTCDEYKVLNKRFGPCICFDKKSGLIYIMGGKQENLVLAASETFNIKTKEQRTFKDLPYQVEGASAQIIERSIYVIGGYDYSQDYKRSFVVYDITKDS